MALIAGLVARDVIGAKDLVDFTVQESAFDRFSKKLGASVAAQLGGGAGQCAFNYSGAGSAEGPA